MNRSKLARSLAVLVASGCAVPATGYAQEGGNTALEEIVVTSRRISENLQQVPVAVSAFTEAALSLQAIEDITELQQRLPNTTLQVSRGTNSTLTAYIRGIGQQDPLWGFEPGVGIYIDDVYVARPQGAVLEVLDVERIEVLRGPQGTLYGKNTIGGAVKYDTKRLSNDPALSIEGRLGSYDQRDIKVAGSVALVPDQLFIGGAIASLQRDGYGEFINQDEDNYDKDIVSGHFKVEWRPSDDLFLRLAYDKTEDDSNAKGGYRLTRSLVTQEPPLSDIYDSRAGQDTDNKVETEGVSALLEWNINEQLTFKSITAAREGETLTNIDFDNTAVNSFDVPALYDDDQFTQEFQLSYSAERWKAVGGLYYYEGEACGSFGVILGLAGITLENGGCVDTESYAAYAQVTFDLTEKLSATLGGRYTRDEKEADVYRFIYLGAVNPWDSNKIFLAAQSNFNNDEEWSEFSPHIGLEYQMSEDVMLYASVKSGFKSGGFDMRGNQSANPNASDPYDPETVETYEIGIKSEFFDRRVRLNAALFYNDYEDMQVTVQRSILGGTDFVSAVVNAASAEMTGVEIELTALVTDQLTLAAQIGYIDAEFQEVDWFDPNQGGVVDISDQWVISNTPEWSANLAATYEMEVAGWQVALTGNIAYRAETHIFELPSVLDMGSYSIVNAGISAVSPDGHWHLGLHGKNLNDKEYRLAGYNFAATFDANGNVLVPGLGGDDTVIGYYGDPRTVSVTLGYRF